MFTRVLRRRTPPPATDPLRPCRPVDDPAQTESATDHGDGDDQCQPPHRSRCEQRPGPAEDLGTDHLPADAPDASASRSPTSAATALSSCCCTGLPGARRSCCARRERCRTIGFCSWTSEDTVRARGFLMIYPATPSSATSWRRSRSSPQGAERRSSGSRWELTLLFSQQQCAQTWSRGS